MQHQFKVQKKRGKKLTHVGFANTKKAGRQVAQRPSQLSGRELTGSYRPWVLINIVPNPNIITWVVGHFALAHALMQSTYSSQSHQVFQLLACLKVCRLFTLFPRNLSCLCSAPSRGGADRPTQRKWSWIAFNWTSKQYVCFKLWSAGMLLDPVPVVGP